VSARHMLAIHDFQRMWNIQDFSNCSEIENHPSGVVGVSKRNKKY
jgi:hypothetical protein